MAAIFVGSGAGAALGAAYLVASPGKPAATPSSGAPAPVAATSLVAPESGPVPATPPLAAARPFRFPAVAAGATDLQCLTEAVYFEARGEPERGQEAVAQVVLNRVRHPAFPKTVCAVVHQKTDVGCQFSFACAPAPRAHDPDAWNRAGAVAKGALHGAVMREIGDATHFESVRASAFAGLLKVAQIGEHVFYRFGGRAGGAGMFHQTPAPSAAPRLVMASLTEPDPSPAVLAAPAPKPPVAATATSAAATAQAGAAPSELKPTAKPQTAPPAAVSTASEVAKPIPSATLKPNAAATPVTQS